MRATLILLALLVGCSSAPKPYDEQFCVSKTESGSCREWVIAPDFERKWK